MPHAGDRRPRRQLCRSCLGVGCALVVMIGAAPGGSPPEVVIHEVCWMGTPASSADEWIELKSNVDRDVPLDGWRLEAEDGTPTIHLSGSVAKRGFYLLERTDDSTVADVSADAIYSGTLENGGETLRLIDDAGNVVDTVVCPDGWHAGSTAPSYATMERINPERSAGASNWKTNDGVTRNGCDASGNVLCGTPRAPNSATKPPVAFFECLPQPATVWDRVEFVDRSTDTDGVVVVWTWDFGDGGASSDASPTHRFVSPGSYRVGLRAEDNDGLVGRYEAEICVILGRGDLDGDGVITILDVRLCQRLALGLPVGAVDAAAADIDLDGDVDHMDVQALAAFVLGL